MAGERGVINAQVDVPRLDGKTAHGQCAAAVQPPVQARALNTPQELQQRRSTTGPLLAPPSARPSAQSTRQTARKTWRRRASARTNASPTVPHLRPDIPCRREAPASAGPRSPRRTAWRRALSSTAVVTAGRWPCMQRTVRAGRHRRRDTGRRSERWQHHGERRSPRCPAVHVRLAHARARGSWIVAPLPQQAPPRPGLPTPIC